MTLYSEIWGEIEKPRTMMGTQTFIRDDHPGPCVIKEKNYQHIGNLNWLLNLRHILIQLKMET